MSYIVYTCIERTIKPPCFLTKRPQNYSNSTCHSDQLADYAMSSGRLMCKVEKVEAINDRKYFDRKDWRSNTKMVRHLKGRGGGDIWMENIGQVMQRWCNT